MQFHEVRFPASLSFGSLGGPERRTEVVTLANGFEERNTPWAHSRRRYDAGAGLRSLDDVETMIAFFEARQGQLYGFRWKDWSDYRSGSASRDLAFDDQIIGAGDATQTVFQLTKTYVSGAIEYVRPLSKLVEGTVRIGVDGSELSEGADWSVDAATGSVTFSAAPPTGAAITAGYEFDVPVRFAIDAIQTSVASFQAGEVPNVPVVELRI
ncbi:MAG: DUF2460 domain-containing protein [Pseudomonadota bacterium]